MPQREAEHNSQDIFFRSPVGAAEAGSTVALGIRIRGRETIHKVILRLWKEGAGEQLTEMTTKAPADSDDRIYRADITMPDAGCLLWYYFIVATAQGTWYYGNNPEHLGGMGSAYDYAPPSFQITVYNQGAHTPNWMKHAVMYQIFPDRFYRAGNAIIKKRGAVIHAAWEDQPCYYKDVDTKEIVNYDFFGGNIQGLKEKLPYLKDLGISLIYLNPVFESESNHHYDTGDYHKIDPLIGTNDEFRDFVAEAKAMGIRVILDGVFSHTGSDSIYFNRNGAYDSLGAFQSQKSPYYEWYNFHKYPYEYDSWWGFSTLPNVTETTPSYMDFIIRNPDSVLHYWMKAGISGWRLDVVDELPPKFTQTFYKELKKTDPEALLIGEVWEDASNKISYGMQREYLCGQEIDSAMNYPFRKIVLDFLLLRVDGRQSMRLLESLRENYPKENFYAMMNLIGSHDVERALTLLGEAPFYDGMPAIHQSRFRLDAEHYQLACKRLLMAAAWQMTYPGAPCVYYGDEIGMQGFRDPYNRAPYAWQSPDENLREAYRKLIRIRNTHEALQTGDFLPLLAEGDVIAYARTIRSSVDEFGKPAKNEALLFVMNRNRTEDAKISLEVGDFAEGHLTNLLDESEQAEITRGVVTLKVPPLTARIYLEEQAPAKYPREAGVLLHPTSLPSAYGVGDLGGEAYRFVDFLAEAGQSIWQILPLGPVGFGYSPYQSPSAFATNPMLLSLDVLVGEGLLNAQDVKGALGAPTAFIDFERAWTYKEKRLRQAYQAFLEQGEPDGYADFLLAEKDWLEDWSLFAALKDFYGDVPWTEWPEGLKKREPKAMADARERLAGEIGYQKFLQYEFHKQWGRLKRYANNKGIRIMGDMPIFVSQDSSDVWTHQKLFKLREDGTAETVAGVPPDYFSATGQLWGNPQYDWEAMRKDNYDWWKRRFKKLQNLVDIVRIDHFRGFESYWEVDGRAKTAINGTWQKGPGKELFDAIEAHVGKLHVVAEDLGIITEAVEQLRDACGYPGMKVLQFTLYLNEGRRVGFVSSENAVVYTGTHDNNTTVGWFTEDIDEPTRVAVAELLGARADRPREVAEKLIAFAYASRARMAIVPMQDILGLTSRARMNTPGTVGINWRWRLKDLDAVKERAAQLHELADTYHRLPTKSHRED